MFCLPLNTIMWWKLEQYNIFFQLVLTILETYLINNHYYHSYDILGYEIYYGNFLLIGAPPVGEKLIYKKF